MNVKHPTRFTAFFILAFVGSSTSIDLTPNFAAYQSRPPDDIACEEAQTAKLLGVPLQKFPAPQGLNGMDEIPATARPFTFTLKPQPPSGPPPRVYFEER